jgi:tetratricopeptide (TPR) repeat protein
MAPEQIAGAPATAASDWYAVGVILFEALVGRLPFEGPAVQVMCEKQVRDAPRLAGRPGVPPDLAALCDGLLARDPAARLDGAAVVARLGGAPVEVTGVHGLARPLFGRDDALGALRDAYLDTRAGAAVTVVIRGASGVGKTALVRHFLSELPPDAIALDGRCYECESVPFKGLDEVVDWLADALAGLRDPRAFFPGDLVPLIRVFPALARIAGIALDDPDGEVAAVGDLRARAFAGFRELIGRLAASRPVVIAIDDAQWGDADGAALLAELVAPPDAPPALVILSCRSDDREPGPLVRALRSNRELALAPLPVSDARALARHVLDAGADPALVERIARASSGSPLLLCELARHLRHGDGAPRDLAAMVLDRVGGLAADARALLEVIAIAGRPVRERIARDAAGVDAAAGGAALASLRAARLVRVRRSGVECHHDHIRAAVVGALEPGRRRARHLRLATTLQALPGADPEALVEHFRAGGEPARAGHHAIRAAERAVRALAFDRAAVYYTLAAELGAASPEIWERLGDARMVLGEHLAAGLAYEQAQAAPPATRDQIRRLRKLATVAQKSGRYGDALALCRRALDLATDPGDLAAASVEALAALTCCYAGDLADGMRWADRAAARLERSLERGAERHVVDAALCRARGNLLLALGQPREAAEVYRRGLAACEALDDRWERSIALFNLGEALAEAGDLEGAMRYLETARAEKSSLGDRWGLGYTWLILARVHAALGDLPRALECARAGATFSAEVGDPKLSSLMHETLSRLMPPAPPPRRRAAHPT